MATNLENALNRIAADPDAHGGPAVLVTDGWQNRGDAERAISAIVSAEIRLDIFTPPGARSIPNVAMTELSLPPALEKAEPFALGVTMENLNDAPVAGTITIDRNGAPIEVRKVTLARGSQRIDFPVRTENSGLASYSASFKPDNPALDTYLEDDSLKGWVGVGSRRKVLILTDSAQDAGYLSTVVQRMGLEPTVVPVTGGAWNGSVAGYDAILLNNVPSERITPAAQTALVAYVNRGGSFAMVGGDSSFGLGGYADSPLAAIMPVTMKPPQHKEQTARAGPDNRQVWLDGPQRQTHLREGRGRDGHQNAEGQRPDRRDRIRLAAVRRHPAAVGRAKPPVLRPDDRPADGARPNLPDARAARGRTHARRQRRAGQARRDPHRRRDRRHADMYYDLVSRMHHDADATISTIAIGKDANVKLLQAIAQVRRRLLLPDRQPAKSARSCSSRISAATAARPRWSKVNSRRTRVNPDAILKDLAARQMPALKGYVSTEIKPRATMSMFVDRGGTREPVIASWKYGAGKAMAVTTDASGRWSGHVGDRQCFSAGVGSAARLDDARDRRPSPRSTWRSATTPDESISSSPTTAPSPPTPRIW